MSLYDRYDAPCVPQPDPALTPAEREAAQVVILTRWLAMPPSARNKRLDQERLRLGYPIPLVPTHALQRKLLLTHDGQTHTVGQWGLILGCSDALIYKRLKLGWSVAEALTPPRVTVTYDQERDACAASG